MANKFLKPIYKMVYGERFSYSNFNARLKMQKMVYLLQELGIGIGDYHFSWYKHGPFSQVLLDDMHLGGSENELNLTEDTMNVIDELSHVLGSKPSEYTQEEWVECIASLCYLNRNLWNLSSEADIISELERRKPHLNNASNNREAFQAMQSLLEV